MKWQFVIPLIFLSSVNLQGKAIAHGSEKFNIKLLRQLRLMLLTILVLLYLMLRSQFMLLSIQVKFG